MTDEALLKAARYATMQALANAVNCSCIGLKVIHVPFEEGYPLLEECLVKTLETLREARGHILVRAKMEEETKNALNSQKN